MMRCVPLPTNFLWRTVGGGKRLHAFYVRSHHLAGVSLVSACGVGPIGGNRQLPECARCLAVVKAEER